MRVTLKCPRCAFERVLDTETDYDQSALMCPSEDHQDTDLVLELTAPEEDGPVPSPE